MKEKVAKFSIWINIILAFSKLTIGFISGSSAIFAAGLDSGMDILSSFISFWGIKTSQKPADQKHPYGHYKFEVLAGLAITIILFLTGLFIIIGAVRGFNNPSSINIGYLAIGVMLISVIINEIAARVKIHFGKQENSMALLSDGYHTRIDVLSSLAILISLFLMKYWIFIDSVLAILIGFYIIKESFSMGKEAVDSLLDISAGEEIEERIKSLVKTKNIKIISLKTQKRGSVITANLDIDLPNNLKVEEVTKISEDLKTTLTDKIKNLCYVTIQITSHEIEIGFFKPEFGKGFGWQRKGKFKETIQTAEGKGPGGDCACPHCDYKIPHTKGLPCSTLKCPKCQINLERK